MGKVLALLLIILLALASVADYLFLTEKIIVGERQIAEGDKQIVKGKDKINVGERRLDAAEVELRREREQLKLAKVALVACALGAALFVSVSFVLGFRWRRLLAHILMHTDA
jgi:cadmium resistance protein CadD (predicted permease)